MTPGSETEIISPNQWRQRIYCLCSRGEIFRIFSFYNYFELRLKKKKRKEKYFLCWSLKYKKIRLGEIDIEKIPPWKTEMWIKYCAVLLRRIFLKSSRFVGYVFNLIFIFCWYYRCVRYVEMLKKNYKRPVVAGVRTVFVWTPWTPLYIIRIESAGSGPTVWIIARKLDGIIFTHVEIFTYRHIQGDYFIAAIVHAKMSNEFHKNSQA